MENLLEQDDCLSAFLNIYWLRPENAIFSAVIAKALNHKFVISKSIDLGCGDGLFAFISLGGRLDCNFDVYSGTSNLEKVYTHDSDIYDHFSDNYTPNITVYPNQKIDYGLDIKETMLNKAKKINIYKKLNKHDNCNFLPFEDNSFETACLFSSIYHYNTEQQMFIFKEVKRILKPGGKFWINVKGYEFINIYKTLQAEYPVNISHFLERNMRNLFIGLHKNRDWEKLFKDSGFKIQKIMPLLPKKFGPLWCIGLRPISPLLIKMSRTLKKLSSGDYIQLKNEWIKLFYSLLLPFYNGNPSYKDSCMSLFLLEKGL